MVLALQGALAGFGLEVRVLAEDAAGSAGKPLREEDAGASVWLRFKANSKLTALTTSAVESCLHRNPPSVAGILQARLGDTLFLGNLHDAESLRLATLLQSGLVFGPGAKPNRSPMAASLRMSLIHFNVLQARLF